MEHLDAPQDYETSRNQALIRSDKRFSGKFYNLYTLIKIISFNKYLYEYFVLGPLNLKNNSGHKVQQIIDNISKKINTSGIIIFLLHLLLLLPNRIFQ